MLQFFQVKIRSVSLKSSSKPQSPSGESCFTLVAKRQHVHPAGLGQETIQSDIAGAAVRNHQLAHSASHGPPDHGMALQNGGRVDDQLGHLAGDGGILLGEEIENAIKVGERPAGEAHPRHGC